MSTTWNVKISELGATTNFSTGDEFVIVQNGETVKIAGNSLASSIATLTNLATRSYVDAIIDLAPETLDTLRELAQAINNDPNFAATVADAINGKLNASEFGNYFEAAWATKNTYHLPEGSNLYFTEQRVLDVVGPIIPTDISQLTDNNGLLGQGGGNVGTDPTYNSVTTTTLNVQNVEFTGTGAVTIASGNDLNLSAAGSVTVNGDEVITKTQLKEIVAASTDFASFKARIAGL